MNFLKSKKLKIVEKIKVYGVITLGALVASCLLYTSDAADEL